MTTHRLPARIAAVMTGTIAVFLLTVGLAVHWLTRSLDRQAADSSVQFVLAAQESLLARTATVTLEYAMSGNTAEAVAAADVDRLYGSVGSTAASGLTTNLVVLWGGPLAGDLGWVDRSPATGTSRLVAGRVLAEADRRLAAAPPGEAGWLDFFVWHRNDLFAVTATRLAAQGLGDSPPARLLMGRRLTLEEVRAITRGSPLEDLRITRGPPAGRLFLPLPGVDGTPVAYLAWRAPRPGTDLLYQMLPFLLAVTGVVLALAAAGILLARRSARHLVEAERRSAVAARTDGLTGLANRAAFGAALGGVAGAGERAVLFLDINGFKRINDGIGHAGGDLVIVEVARRLAGLAGLGAWLFRIAGDEFVFVLGGPGAGGRVQALAEACERALAAPFAVLGHQMRLRLAMGYAVQADASATGADLVRQADLAMYEAKRHKALGAVAFSALLDQAARDAALLERALRGALERGGELALAYQPILDRAGRLVRAEALARWTSPEIGPVPPSRFIPVAERAGLMVELGRQLLARLCDDLAAHPGLRVALNVSPLQLLAPDFVPALVGALARRGLDPARVEVELTESVIVDDPRLAAERLSELHAAGLSTALDDFGTGYSSVGYLRQMGFHTLKIDKSFVAGLGHEPAQAELLLAIIRMAHALGLTVTAEGIETEAELRLLHAMGCDHAQGYAIDPPLPLPTLREKWMGDRPEGRLLPLPEPRPGDESGPEAAVA